VNPGSISSEFYCDLMSLSVLSSVYKMFCSNWVTPGCHILALPLAAVESGVKAEFVGALLAGMG
jgi:hypothetical protein